MPKGACMVRGAHVVKGGMHDEGGVCDCWGACMVSGGDVNGSRGACVPEGVCKVRGHVW